MLELGILYTGNQQVWKPLDQVAAFRPVEVLTFSITSERGNRAALKDRMWSRQNNDSAGRPEAWWGDDFYAIGLTSDGRYFTTQWDERDEKLYTWSVEDGRPMEIIDRSLGFPSDAVVTIFKGGYLPPVEWEKALAIFETEMF